MSYLKGIDTSKWQSGLVDYAKGKQAGYEFVILRIGYNTTKDPYFESDYARAKAAGMKIGIYYYTTKITEADAVNDANRVLGWLGTKTLDMPIAYDMEEPSIKSASRKDLNSKQYNAFAKVIKEKGFVSMLYTGSSMFNSYFNKDLITDPIWIAKYSINDGKNHGCPNVGKQVAIHQYTSAAVSSDFYTGKLDRNQMMISYEELMNKDSNSTPTSKPDTPTTSTTVLKATSTKKGVQTYLNTYYGNEIKTVLGSKLAVDGIFGSKSKKAVAIALQVELNKLGANLKVDGLFGSGSASAFTKYVGTLKKGSKGIFVTLWQCLLVGLGYNPKGIDGISGNGFVNATNLCLKAYGLSPDSVVNASDINKIL